MTIGGSVARNIDFEVANFEVPLCSATDVTAHEKTCRKMSMLKLRSVNI